MSSKKGSGLGFLIRLVVGVGLLVVLFLTVDLKAVLKEIAGLSPIWLVAGAAVIVALRVLMSMRWQHVLSLQGIDVGLWELIRITFISMFFGHFLPGGLGVDVVKGYELVSRRGQTADVAATLILDRFIGVYSMFSVALVGAIIGQATGHIDKIYVIPLVTAQFLILGGWFVGFLVVDAVSKRNWFAGTKLEKLWGKMLRMLRAITDLPKIRTIFLRVFALSVIVQLGRCLLFLCMYRAFGEAVTYVDCVTIIPLVYVVVLVPVSVGGLGVREGALMMMFEPLGVPPEVSVSVGLVSHVLQLAVALPGVAFWIFDQKKAKAKA